MNDQQGMMVIGLVVFMASLTTAMLYLTQQQMVGMIEQNQQYASYLQQKQQALSALQWASSVVWSPRQGQWQCQRLARYALRACLYQDGQQLLLRGEGQAIDHLLPLYFYQWQDGQADKQGLWLQPARHGWSDVCPLSVACHD